MDSNPFLHSEVTRESESILSCSFDYVPYFTLGKRTHDEILSVALGMIQGIRSLHEQRVRLQLTTKVSTVTLGIRNGLRCHM